VIAVGSLSKLKDFGTLVRAFSIVRKTRHCRLVILGEGQERGKLEVLINELGLQGDVMLPGFVSNPFPWIKKAALFVSSSLTEGCPNSLMQALACNTAVVSTDCVGGSAEILQDGKWGMLVPVGDAETMAEAVLATLSSVHKTDAVRRANDFALDKIVAEYLDVLFPEGLPINMDDQS
jgi:glycosyltransferase involved in cell wall biosynthesis